MVCDSISWWVFKNKIEFNVDLSAGVRRAKVNERKTWFSFSFCAKSVWQKWKFQGFSFFAWENFNFWEDFRRFLKKKGICFASLEDKWTGLLNQVSIKMFWASLCEGWRNFSKSRNNFLNGNILPPPHKAPFSVSWFDCYLHNQRKYWYNFFLFIQICGTSTIACSIYVEHCKAPKQHSCKAAIKINYKLYIK